MVFLSKLNFEECEHYNKRAQINNIEFKDPFTILSGNNGAGKSTIIKVIKDYFDNEAEIYFKDKDLEKIKTEIEPNTKCFCFSAHDDNGKYKPYIDDDIHALFMSEGESIYYCFYTWLKKVSLKIEVNRFFKEKELHIKENLDKLNENELHFIKKKINNIDDYKPFNNVILLIDEIDSGLSPDILLKIVSKIKSFSEKYEVQFIIASNNYLFMKEFKNILWVNNGEHFQTPKNHEEFIALYKKERTNLTYEFINKKVGNCVSIINEKKYDNSFIMDKVFS